jgi:hypothetical protein
MAQQSQSRKKEVRGKFLTILLILNVFFSGILTLPEKISKVLFLHQTGIWRDTLLSLIFTALVIVITIGMWQWRKAAVYAHFVYLVVIFTSLIVPLFFLFPKNQFAGWTAVWALIALALWYLAIKPKWYLFT